MGGGSAPCCGFLWEWERGASDEEGGWYIYCHHRLVEGGKRSGLEEVL